MKKSVAVRVCSETSIDDAASPTSTDDASTVDSGSSVPVILTSEPLSQEVQDRRPASKGYRTAQHSKNPELSEGDSESDDPNIIWRGLKVGEVEDIKAGRGLKAELSCSPSMDIKSDIKKHIELGRDHKSCLISTTRSKKVAARYASCKKNGEAPEPSYYLAKIVLDKDINKVDLTNVEEIGKVNLNSTAKKWAENSQEVIIVDEIPRKNITEVRKVECFFSRETKHVQYQYSREENSNKEGHDFVRFRPCEKDDHYGFHIKPPLTLPAFKMSAAATTPPQHAAADGTSHDTPVEKATIKPPSNS